MQLVPAQKEAGGGLGRERGAEGGGGVGRDRGIAPPVNLGTIWKFTPRK
jgi:hypothetical protein